MESPETKLLVLLSLLFAVSMLAMLSEKLRISYPIFLVIGGLAISRLPHMPVITLDPELVFVIFLPPLLYSAAWNTSWSEFWFYRRAIGLLSFGLVFITAIVIALLSTSLIPGFSLPLGFLLGGIISPPDAVAATSVLQGIKVPKRIVTLLEAESLVNDASSLIVFRFALASLLTGQFILWKAGVDFLWVIAGGVLVGLAIAHIVYAVHRFLPTTPSIDTALSLISPYLMYIAAEHFHCSGVLAVVSGGLFLSFRAHDLFSYNSRLQTQVVWNTLVFLFNGLVFILIGLQLPVILKSLDGYSIGESLLYAVVISIATIFIRICWVFPGAYLPRMLSKRIRKREANPGWKSVLVVAWSGMRGVVSLASALSIPLTLSDGTAFPHRNLILFVTFVVIFITLVLQGLSLPFLVKWLNIDVHENEAMQDSAIRLRMANAVLDFINASYGEESEKNEPFNRVKARYQRMVEFASKKLEEEESKEAEPSFMPRYRQFLLDVVAIRRRELYAIRNEKLYTDELIRKKEFELDLEEARLRRG